MSVIGEGCRELEVTVKPASSGALVGCKGKLLMMKRDDNPNIPHPDKWAILGGISIKGGRGKIMNVFGGVVLLGVIQNGLVVLGISPYVRRVLFGCLVIVAIIFDLLRIKVRESVMKGA